MKSKKSFYPLMIKETYLDLLGHVNNSMYLILFEEARWDLITKNGYGLPKILETGLAPVILEAKVQFLKELKLREEIVIETETFSYQRKIGVMMQKMVRSGEVCCSAEFTFGLMNLQERKLVIPTPEWLQACGITG